MCGVRSGGKKRRVLCHTMVIINVDDRHSLDLSITLVNKVLSGDGNVIQEAVS